MAEANKGKSDFVKFFNKNKAAAKVASKAKRSALLDNDMLIDMYGLKDGASVIVTAKVKGVTLGTHDKGDYSGLGYMSTNLLLSSKSQSGAYSVFRPLYDRKEKEVTEDSLKWVFFDFQALGYETDGWGIDEIIEAVESLEKEQPTVKVKISCVKMTRGANIGKLAVNVNIIGLVDKDEEEELEEDTDEVVDEEEDSEEEESEEEEEEEEEVKPASKAKAAKSSTKWKLNDVCSFTDDDGTYKVTITEVNKNGTYTIENDEYKFEDITDSQLSPWVEPVKGKKKK